MSAAKPGKMSLKIKNYNNTNGKRFITWLDTTNNEVVAERTENAAIAM